jgi:hypothetical protein
MLREDEHTRQLPHQSHAATLANVSSGGKDDIFWHTAGDFYRLPDSDLRTGSWA